MMVFDCFNTKDNHETENLVSPNCTEMYFVSICPHDAAQDLPVCWSSLSFIKYKYNFVKTKM